jgi:parallel beta-helix repeat protein
MTGLSLLVLGSIARAGVVQTNSLVAGASNTDTVHVAPPTGVRDTDRANVVAALERIRPGGTIQFAPGTYLIGDIITVSIPWIAFRGHPDGTTLRGCEPAEYDLVAKEAASAADGGWITASRCGTFQLTAGHVTVRDLTFEYTYLGLSLGCCPGNRVFQRTDGGYRIEGNTFRNSGNGVRPELLSPDPTVIRANRFINTFHAVSGGASHIQVLENDISVPEPDRVPGYGHPTFAIAIGAVPPHLVQDGDSAARVCEQNVIAGNRIDGHPDGIFLPALPGTVCRNNVIRDNTIIVRRQRLPATRIDSTFPRIVHESDSTIVGVPLWLLASAGPPGQGGVIEHTEIEDNRIIGAEGVGIELFRASRNRIVNNTINGVVPREPFPGNTHRFGFEVAWGKANGAGLWISPGTNANEIAGNTFEDIAGHAVVLEGDSNVVETRSASDSVRDLGKSNRVRGPAPSPDGAETDGSVVPRAAADTLDYVVLNHGRLAGGMRVVVRGDSVLVDHHRRDRFRRTRQRALYVMGANGSLRALETRGLLADSTPGDVEERFEITGRTARWRSAIDSGEVPVDGPAFYQPYDDNPWGPSLLARFLLGRPNYTASLLPHGSGRSVIAADTTLEVGGVRQRLRLVHIYDVYDPDGPTGVWLSDDGSLVATDAAWLITVRRGAEGILPTLRAIEHAYHARVAEAAARRLAPPSASAVVIRDGDVFDSERGVLLPRTTVVIKGDRIVAVGPASSTAIPAGARIIEAAGKTVLPGLWDMHTHAHGFSEKSVMHLAAGVTTIRDVGSDVDVAVSLRDRAEKGTELSPRVLLAGFLEGPGDWAGPTDAIVTTEDEARRWIARYDSLGYRQVKLYWFVHPALLPAIIAEAKRRGLRVSGHLPVGIGLHTIVRMGLDEIQHAPSLIATFFPDSTFFPVARPDGAIVQSVAPTFDVDGPPVTELLTLLRERGTVIDGAFNLQYGPFRARPLPDGTDRVFGSTLDWLPPLARRWLTSPRPPDTERAARVDAAYALYLRLLKRLFDAGVTLVPGTDNVPGLSYHGELETYERAGIPANRVLQIATIVPARVMGDEKDYGSITPGKVADLVVVDGQPATRIRDLRRTELVVRAGRVYAARDLYAAAGLTPH